MMTRKFLVVNGPNLNMLGLREPEVYGAETLADIERDLIAQAAETDAHLTFFQSNSEGDLVTEIQKAKDVFDGVIINPAAYSHTSVAIHDALRLLSVPIIEVHLTNIHTREPFRHHSYVSAVATGVICGLGSDGYKLALNALLTLSNR